ncbi:hypothetical protein JOD54_004862 [Actinokineospora baliensis]|uniref:hypothetical protein n=1 Tax=Actinokineospora baliensis TaxID=547056 RepID=UPI0019565A61|nr:hypothetical protein [Actinokineospora baliensis]MBM7774658.1 hypothetical protein [Actinokineospora baliensis]
MRTPPVPGIGAHARTATRLHPSAGSPTSADSHIGGPMRWPADETWPYCADPLPDGSFGQALVGVAQFYRRDFPASDGCSCETDETVVGWEFGREGALNILVCPNNVEHRPIPWVD